MEEKKKKKKGGSPTQQENPKPNSASVKEGNKQVDQPATRTIMLTRVAPTGVRQDGPAKRLSNANFKAKKEKGLCFHRDDNYFVGHKCKTKEL